MIIYHLARLLLMMLCIIVLDIQAQGFTNEFFQNRKRGWFWFEETPKDEVKEITDPRQAKEWIEQFKYELDNARNLMFASPTVENTAKYMRLEDAMWNHGMKLYHSSEMAKFVHPELARLDTEPTNVIGVRANREELHKSIGLFTVSIAKDFDLVLFRSGNCRYCKEFEPVLKDFGDKYGFNVEAISMDETISEHFTTKKLPHLAAVLNIEATPTVVMVHKSKPVRFELMRGFLSMQELEKRFEIVKKYLERVYG